MRLFERYVFVLRLAINRNLVKDGEIAESRCLSQIVDISVIREIGYYELWYWTQIGRQYGDTIRYDGGV